MEVKLAWQQQTIWQDSNEAMDLIWWVPCLNNNMEINQTIIYYYYRSLVLWGDDGNNFGCISDAWMAI